MQELPIVDTSETVPDGFAMGMNRCHFAEAGHQHYIRCFQEKNLVLVATLFKGMQTAG